MSARITKELRKAFGPWAMPYDRMHLVAQALVAAVRKAKEPYRVRFANARVRKPPLVPDTPLFALNAPAGGVTHAFHLWEQATYGFVATRELYDEGYTPATWAKSSAPFVYKHLSGFAKGADRAVFPILLQSISRYKGLSLEGSVVRGGPYPIGVDDGKVLGKFAEGHALDVDMGILYKALPGAMKVSFPHTITLLAMILSIPNKEVQAQAHLYFRLMLYHLGDRAVSEWVATWAKFAIDDDALPHPNKIHQLLSTYEKSDITRALSRVLVPKHASAREFESLFGNPSHLTVKLENKAYSLFYKYQSFYQEKVNC